MVASVEVIARVVELAQTVVPCGAVGPIDAGSALVGEDAVFDSVELLEFLSAVEDDFGVRLRYEDVAFAGFASVGALALTISRTHATHISR